MVEAVAEIWSEVIHQGNAAEDCSVQPINEKGGDQCPQKPHDALV